MTNIGRSNGIKILLNTTNDMDNYVISFRNNWVTKPVSFNNTIRVASEY